MTTPSATEQYILELINDARLNPLGNAARYISSYSPLTSGNASIQNNFTFWGVNGTALLAAFQALTPAKPLAWNDNIGTAATNHSNAMIAADTQSHQLPGELDVGGRMAAAGYTGANAWAENVFAFASDPLMAHAGFMVDWGTGANGMQSPPGHRNNIMNNTYREIGISAIAENNGGTSVGPLVVTEDFGLRNAGPQVFILGVAYNDTDANKFYSIGEGLGTLNVNAGGPSTTSAASGGYTLGLNAGATTLTYTGGGLASAVTVTGNFANGSNIKIDIVGGNTLLTSGSVSVTGPITTIKGLGLTGLSLTAGSGNQTMIGTAGNDTMDGGIGNDTLDGNGGVNSLIGGDNNDTYIVGNAADSITEQLNQGSDTVISFVTYTLPSNVEAIYTIAGGGATGNSLANLLNGSYAASGQTLNGGDGNDVIYGTPFVDLLIGGPGSDAIYGLGGTDTMQGNAGDDAYFVSVAGTTVQEDGGNGTDTIYASVNLTLPINVEVLIPYGAATTGTGNASANVLIGTNGAQALTLNGGGADDTIYGSNFGDTLVGSTGNDYMQGYGGNDTMQGGSGDDVYIVEQAGDVVTEGAGEGTDTVYATVNITLAANVENLFVYGSATSGTGNSGNNAIINYLITTGVTLSGGGGADYLQGYSGNDTLIGGTGADKMTGMGGSDTFQFAPGDVSGDTINDFATGADKLRFVGFGAGANFTQIDATHWQVNYNANATHETITIANGSTFQVGDVLFV